MSKPATVQAEVQQIAELLDAKQFDKAMASSRRLLKKAPDSPVLNLLLAMALAGDGKLDPAVHHYRQALKLKPGWFEALNNLGVAYLKLGKLREAADSFLAALKASPGNPDVLRNLDAVLPPLSGSLFKDHRFEESAQVLRTLLALRPDFPNAAFELGLTLLKLGQLDEAAAFLSQAVERAPEHVRPMVFLALAERARGRDYQPLLARILDVPTPQWRDVGIKMWAALALDKPEVAFALRAEPLNIVDFEALAPFADQHTMEDVFAQMGPLSGTLPSSGPRLLLYAAADGVYAAKYAKALIESALKNGPDCDFHFHIMNPGAFKPDQAFRALPRERLTWTVEDCDAPDKTVFSTRRFKRLAQIMAQTERTVVALDTDILVNGDIGKALPADFDVLLYDRPDEPFVYQMVNAGLMGFSPRGRAFLDFVAQYIHHFDMRGEARWFVDQMAIVAARAWFQRHRPSLSITEAAPEVMGWDPARAPTYILWHQKGQKDD